MPAAYEGKRGGPDKPVAYSLVNPYDDRADVAEVRAAFRGWHPLVRDMIDAMDAPLKWALFDRDPLPSWGRGPVVLLGDACHPMLPYGAQGYAQAVEDAAVLAACLAAVAGQMVDAVANPAYQFGEVSLLFWLVVGLGMSAAKIAPSAEAALKEAARALRIREGTVMSRLYRARQQVVRRLEGGTD